MLEIAEINAFYGQSHVLHNVSLTIGDRERVAVLGRNGAGKSTLLKSIMNGGPRVAGNVLLDGDPLGTIPPSERVRLGLSLVPEDRRIFTHISVAENILLAQRGVGKRADMPEMEVILNAFPTLRSLTSRRGGQLSGGQQQLLAVARAIASRPRMILLDEPTEGLAPVLVESLAREVIAACEHFGIALLLAEQSVWFARKCTSRVLILDSGSLVFSGDWETFDASTKLVERYLTV